MFGISRHLRRHQELALTDMGRCTWGSCDCLQCDGGSFYPMLARWRGMHKEFQVERCTNAQRPRIISNHM